jgi:small subunit ribosomal protein S13
MPLKTNINPTLIFRKRNTLINILNTPNTPTPLTNNLTILTAKLPPQSKQKPNNKAKSSNKSAGTLLRKNSKLTKTSTQLPQRKNKTQNNKTNQTKTQKQKKKGFCGRFRHILRITDTDVDGTLKVPYALRKIKGISLNLANAILKKAGIDSNMRAGFLTEAEVEKIEEIIKEPTKYGLPGWLLNRRKDLETGKDLHLISADLILRTKMDIEKMKELKSWRGYRHAYGLKVRGQRTRTTGRTGKAVGVKKKAAAKPGGGGGK